jgi:hypothetical protein
MKKILAAIVLASVAAATWAQPYTYEPTVVKLNGTLLSAAGETADGKRIPFPAIQLSAPITVQGSSDDPPTEKGVMLLHMVLNEKTMITFKSLKGKAVEVVGTLFHSDNANHQTNVLVTPTSITLANQGLAR